VGAVATERFEGNQKAKKEDYYLSRETKERRKESAGNGP
jgi:hypothetical protein